MAPIHAAGIGANLSGNRANREDVQVSSASEVGRHVLLAPSGRASAESLLPPRLKMPLLPWRPNKCYALADGHVTNYCNLAYSAFACFYLFLVLAFLFSIPTIIPEGGSFLFSFAAAAINFFTPGLFTSATLRSLTCRTPFPVPSNSFSGSCSAAPRINANVTCSLPTMKGSKRKVVFEEGEEPAVAVV